MPRLTCFSRAFCGPPRANRCVNACSSEMAAEVAAWFVVYGSAAVLRVLRMTDAAEACVGCEKEET